MHPARKATRWVNDHGVFAVPGRHSDHAKQFDGQLSLSAADTRSHRPIGAPMPARIGRRSLALDHGSVYRHRTVSQNHPAKLAHFKIVGVGQLRRVVEGGPSRTPRWRRCRHAGLVAPRDFHPSAWMSTRSSAWK
ncbi:hypothetical protein I553_1266 [Mycobacterium xenopi 4042]|uniref:Uncharacterized protein n=1 Tax=Mycobacterium xenopi 4042 TaxID=1299334 RepID=X8CE17_MYCXE|nr:hypothetical protein I553_1266 [Mycobacterium xenopi 4042]